MRDKRPVDELSIEELERILVIRKREARMEQRQRMKRDGRVVTGAQPKLPPVQPQPVITVTSPQPVEDESATLNESEPVAVPDQVELPVDNSQPRFEDEARAEQRTLAAPRSKKQNRKLMDRLLMLVEIAAVIGIALIGVNLFTAIGTLERETEQAQALADEQRRLGIPTIEPTPTIRLDNIVLPTGHIYSDTGIVEFNINEIPEHLRPVVQSQLLQPVLSRPAPTEETAMRIVIPKINIDEVIVPGTDPGALRLGVGQLINGIDPGDREGNLVLAAHNDIYGQIFRYLDQLEPGDEFTVYTQIQAHNYIVASIETVEPNDVWVMENQAGRAMATLISCYPYQQNYERIVVFADRIN
ncbi:MAG: sortase [Anaerolineae bacterium]|nr:sortase [Anaerolineae bacterium]